jgi:hypothetical protein
VLKPFEYVGVNLPDRGVVLGQVYPATAAIQFYGTEKQQGYVAVLVKKPGEKLKPGEQGILKVHPSRIIQIADQKGFSNSNIGEPHNVSQSPVFCTAP